MAGVDVGPQVELNRFVELRGGELLKQLGGLFRSIESVAIHFLGNVAVASAFAGHILISRDLYTHTAGGALDNQHGLVYCAGIQVRQFGLSDFAKGVAGDGPHESLANI